MKGINFLLTGVLLMMPLLSSGQDVSEGEALYGMYCTQCHGTQADGNGINALHMSVHPRSHIDRQEMSARSDADLYKVIDEGGKSINKSILMPAWGDNLEDSQIESLVLYLRVLCCSDE